jgi:hypothetical protein
VTYTPKTIPSPAWTEGQIYLWHERLAIMFDGARAILTHTEYGKVWDWVNGQGEQCKRPE